MRKVTIFELQRNIGEQLEDLPFQITKYGKVVATVNRYNVTLNKPATKIPNGNPQNGNPKVDVTKIQETKNIDVCKHGSMKGLCRFGCK